MAPRDESKPFLEFSTNTPPTPLAGLNVLDLFTGLGGLAAGFRDAGFVVHGADKEDVAGDVYTLDKLGTFHKADLASELVLLDVAAVVGGPPCRPWSTVNLQLRRTRHPDHMLLDRFFQHIMQIRPEVFLMENVLALKSDDTYRERVAELRRGGYSVESQIIRYSDYGAASSRRRLFTVGVMRSSVGAASFFEHLARYCAPAQTVRGAIHWARDIGRGEHADHDWSELATIDKYAERYRTGQYGWKKLKYDEPAPSFGSISKTYILHPEAGDGCYPWRVLSVREAMSIAGFARSFQFPPGVPRTKRYQMVANAVSPVVSRAVAEAMKGLLGAGAGAVRGSQSGEPTPVAVT